LLRCLFRAVCRHPGAFSLTPVHAWTRFVRIGQTRLGSGQAFAQDQSHTSQLALALEITHAHLCLAKITIGKFRRDPKRGPSWFTKVLGALTPAWCRIVDRIKILSLTKSICISVRYCKSYWLLAGCGNCPKWRSVQTAFWFSAD
jgi:hypothetical protein